MPRVGDFVRSIRFPSLLAQVVEDLGYEALIVRWRSGHATEIWSKDVQSVGPSMPQVGALYRRKGGGFVSMHVGMNDQISARILANRFDVGFTTPLMSVASFWEMVA